MTRKLRPLLAAAAIAGASLATTQAVPTEVSAANCVARWYQASGGAGAGGNAWCSDVSHKVRIWCANGGSYVGFWVGPNQYSFANCPWGVRVNSAITLI